MLIKPNLSTESEFNKDNCGIYNSSLDVTFINRNTIKIKKKKEVEYGLIYIRLFDEYARDDIVAFSGKLELLKGHDLMIRFNGFDAEPILISKVGVNRVERIGKKYSAQNQAQVRVFHDDEVIFRYNKIKLEKDTVTPYIPNENSIETAKRQYFIGGELQRGVSRVDPKGVLYAS